MLLEATSVLAQSNAGSNSDSSSDGSGMFILIVVLIFVGLILADVVKRFRKSPQDSKGKLGADSTDTGVTSDSIASKKFQPTKFSEGYDQDQVDDFLDLVTQELRRLETGTDPLQSSVTTPLLTPEDVVNKRFQPTKFREGYDQDQVDDYLDEIVVALRHLATENDRLQNEKSTIETSRDI